MLQLQLWLVVFQSLAVQHVPLDLLQLLYQLLCCLRLRLLIMQGLPCCCNVCCWVLIRGATGEVGQPKEQVDCMPSAKGFLVHVPAAEDNSHRCVLKLAVMQTTGHASAQRVPYKDLLCLGALDSNCQFAQCMPKHPLCLLINPQHALKPAGSCTALCAGHTRSAHRSASLNK